MNDFINLHSQLAQIVEQYNCTQSSCAVVVRGFVAQIGRRACYPFPQTDLAYWLSDGYAKSSVAVEDGDTDLDLCDLPIKVPRHQRLAE